MNDFTASEIEAWFYFRDPYFVESVPPKDRQVFESEGPYEHEKLTALKLEITQSKYPSRTYARPSQMADFFLEDMRSYIDVKYPKVMLLQLF